MENKRHVQLPGNTDHNLTPKDLLIYVTIKRHMNAATKEAFPSMERIATLASSTKPTVKTCIENLEQAGYLTIRREGRKNVYVFNDYKNFEPFSYEFLDKPDLTANEKAYLIASQHFMIKDNGVGKITYSDRKLAKNINMSPSSVAKYNASLSEKGYMNILSTEAKDPETGLYIDEKFFHLNELEQAIVFTLRRHEEDIQTNTAAISNLEKDRDVLMKTITQLQNEMRKLKKEQDGIDL